MTKRNTISVQIISFLLVITAISCGKTEKSTPEISSDEVKEETATSNVKLFFKIDIEKLESAKPGEVVEAILDDGSIYRLYIRSIEETMPGIKSISANIENAETGLATFILRDKKLAGSVAMYADGMSYKMAFDPESGKHYITPVNPDEILQGSKPMEVPKNGG